MESWSLIRATRAVPVTSGFVGYAERAFTVTPRGKHCRPGSHTSNRLMPTPGTTPENRENVGQWGQNIVNRVSAKGV